MSARSGAQEFLPSWWLTVMAFRSTSSRQRTLTANMVPPSGVAPRANERIPQVVQNRWWMATTPASQPAPVGDRTTDSWGTRSSQLRAGGGGLGRIVGDGREQGLLEQGPAGPQARVGGVDGDVEVGGDLRTGEAVELAEDEGTPAIVAELREELLEELARLDAPGDRRADGRRLRPHEGGAGPAARERWRGGTGRRSCGRCR
jgi:hypothetical protein